MKEAAISYYTDERLPKESGEFKQMTLSEMIGLKLITPLIDKNNKAVDVEKSYVKITKSGNEYILKVNIKDSEKEDYILVHLGCYTYCDSTICEKKETEVVVKGSIVNDKTPIVKKYYCQIVNGKYYSKSGNVVNKAFRLSPLAHGVEPKTDILQHFGVQVFLIIVESHTGLN